jgi:hypothetical protein
LVVRSPPLVKSESFNCHHGLIAAEFTTAVPLATDEPPLIALAVITTAPLPTLVTVVVYGTELSEAVAVTIEVFDEEKVTLLIGSAHTTVAVIVPFCPIFKLVVAGLNVRLHAGTGEGDGDAVGTGVGAPPLVTLDVSVQTLAVPLIVTLAVIVAVPAP